MESELIERPVAVAQRAFVPGGMLMSTGRTYRNHLQNAHIALCENEYRPEMVMASLVDPLPRRVNNLDDLTLSLIRLQACVCKRVCKRDDIRACWYFPTRS